MVRLSVRSFVIFLAISKWRTVATESCAILIYEPVNYSIIIVIRFFCSHYLIWWGGVTANVVSEESMALRTEGVQHVSILFLPESYIKICV